MNTSIRILCLFSVLISSPYFVQGSNGQSLRSSSTVSIPASGKFFSTIFEPRLESGWLSASDKTGFVPVSGQFFETELVPIYTNDRSPLAFDPETPVKPGYRKLGKSRPPSVWKPWLHKADIPYRFSLRVNLLRWATLTPDIGIELRISRKYGVSIQGSYIYWSWNEWDRRYAVLEIAPQIRRYLGRNGRSYIGLMFHGGSFNYKLSENGIQGDFLGGGLTGGYQLPVGRHLFFDFGAGIGYAHIKYDRYFRYTEPYGIELYRKEKGKMHYIGINHLSIGLVWVFGGYRSEARTIGTK